MDLLSIQKQREAFAKDAAPLQKVRNSENNAFGGFIFNDEKYYKVGRWPCHGWLSSYSFQDLTKRAKNTTGVKYILSAVMKPHCTEAQLKAYIDWLVNRSVWKDVFLDKDPDNIIKLGHVISTELPNAFVASGCIASRFMTEVYSDVVSKRAEGYFEFLHLGCTEDEAFFLAHIYAPIRPGSTYPMKYSRLSSGHSTFYNCNFDLQYAKNFLTRTPRELNKTFKEHGGYGNDSINSIWGIQNSRDPFHRTIGYLRPLQLTLTKDHHIFRRKSVDVFEYDTPENLMSIVNQFKELVYA